VHALLRHICCREALNEWWKGRLRAVYRVGCPGLVLLLGIFWKAAAAVIGVRARNLILTMKLPFSVASRPQRICVSPSYSRRSPDYCHPVGLLESSACFAQHSGFSSAASPSLLESHAACVTRRRLSFRTSEQIGLSSMKRSMSWIQVKKSGKSCTSLTLRWSVPRDYIW
jgi:hypothetical protein